MPRANCFSFDAVLLAGEGEGDVVFAQEDGNGVVGGAEDVAVASEGDVTEAEGGGFVFGACMTVFTWSHEEVEANPDDVSDALQFGVAADVLCEDVVQDGCWEWFDVVWRRVCSSVAAYLA